LFFSSPKRDPGEILERKAIKKRRNLKKETNLTVKRRKKKLCKRKLEATWKELLESAQIKQNGQ
jgi:hypothetical protein